jgi:predicted transcriptional regulator
VDPAWLEDGELTVATDGDPYAPALRQTETVRQASRFRGLLPSIELEGAKLVHERVVDGDMEATVVLSAAAAETVRSDPFAELFREKLATGRLEVYAYEGEVPMYLGLADDDRVELGCENEQGIPQALLQSNDDRLREWGEERFGAYVRNSKKLTQLS